MLFKFMESVICLALKYNASVSSWGRTPEHNAEVGGHPQSWHMLWLGMDVIFKPMVKNVEFEGDADLLGLQAIFEGDHYHLEPKAAARVLS
jgi:hypothetical protein